MTILRTNPLTAPLTHLSTLSTPSLVLLMYGVLMLLAFVVTFVVSLNDARTIRDIGIWIKPMKFMAATAIFAWTSVWVVMLSRSAVAAAHVWGWIAALLISTSLFEVVYITYQAAQGSGSHYNISTPLNAALFALMGIAAIGLVASQAWLAWEIWKRRTQQYSVITLGVVIGLSFTFLFSAISGFLLGGNQPPPGQGLPFLGWHLFADIRPAHFVGVHAQQLIPLIGLLAVRFAGKHARRTLVVCAVLYADLWVVLTGFSFVGIP
jgi:hypothetical protein